MRTKKTGEPKIPTIMVVFGVTGDLMQKKITPALFNLFKNDSLPERFKIIGFARRDLSDKDFKEKIAGMFDKVVPDFLSLFGYERGFFEKKKDYIKLALRLKEIDKKWGMCSNKLFYLAVPPELYPEILKNLHSTGLSRPCGGPEEGWTRVIVEKPFGKDLKSAKFLDDLLRKLFREEQIYRIDHYLAKEMLQNILAFRFYNNLFEFVWGKKLIESVNIRLFESIGVEDRGGFYDGVGALRDVGQNHLLQMLALVTMDKPPRFTPEDIRRERAKILSTLRIPSDRDIKKYTTRGQYDDYRLIKGVASDSNTETYFKVRALLNHPRWRGVPIFMESGKNLGRSVKEIEINFRHETTYKNSLIIRMEPRETITIDFWSKKPGRKMNLQKKIFTFNLRKPNRIHRTEEYEKLLSDCISDDQTLFVSSKEIEAMWRFIDPIIAGWAMGLSPLKRYKPGSLHVS